MPAEKLLSPAFAQLCRHSGDNAELGTGCMRRLMRVLLYAFVLGVAYAVWPVHTALEIREAMIAGDTATLNRKIEWEALRTSLKTSISPETIARLKADPEAPRPTLWQRVKAVMAPKMAGTVIDRYITPENLPVLLGYQRLYRGVVRPALGLKEPPTALAGTLLVGTSADRFASFWARVRRAVFDSPGVFEFEVEDKYRPERRYIGTLKLRGWEWKLTGLAVTGNGL
jgi:Protein of unknown function (DUF2939)